MGCAAQRSLEKGTHSTVAAGVAKALSEGVLQLPPEAPKLLLHFHSSTEWCQLLPRITVSICSTQANPWG